MVPSGPRHRRQPSHVYRVRRALAATAVVVALFLCAQLVGAVTGGGDEEATTTTVPETTTTTIPPVPPCVEGDLVVPGDPAAEWATLIVDTERALGSGYHPNDLRNIADAGFPLTDGLAVRALVIPDLDAMRQAAADNGTPLSIIAGYRSFEQQAALFDRRVTEMGVAEAGSRVARPGHSEHQLGTTIDVTTEGDTDVGQAWGASPAGQWVATNAHKYGFIISYPQDAQTRTCYDYEPWHLRYVGREMAADVIASGLTLREYLWSLNPVDLPATTIATTGTTAP
ncbi:MAG: M15 family metallopeptidase [Acidimicrobiales bacterium]